jgi:hypothetical protein
VLQPGREAQVTFVGQPSLTLPDGLFYPSGSECPIPGDVFDFQPVRSNQDESTSFLIRNFPSGGYLVGPSGGRVELPSDGPLLVKWK